MSVPRDIDLTRHLDFNKEDSIGNSINIPKDRRDDSYKRYNEYKDDSFSSTTTVSDYDPMDRVRGAFLTLANTLSSTTGISNPYTNTLWGGIKRVEERVCWRKLYKDPRIFEERHTPEEWVEIHKNYHFPLGSKEDRAAIFFEIERNKRQQYYDCCECCGRSLNKNICYSHVYELCERCNYYLNNREDSVRS